MTASTPTLFFAKPQLQALLDELRGRGFCVVGPTIEQEAIVYSELQSVDELPRGWTDEQAPGQYRLKRRDDEAWFGFVVGPHSWKKYLFPPKVTLLSAEKTEQHPEAVGALLLRLRALRLGLGHLLQDFSSAVSPEQGARPRGNAAVHTAATPKPTRRSAVTNPSPTVAKRDCVQGSRRCAGSRCAWLRLCPSRRASGGDSRGWW